MIKHMAILSITLFLMIGVYSAVPSELGYPATSSNPSVGPWLFVGAYENYTLSGNYSAFGNTYLLTGSVNTTIIQFNNTAKSIEVRAKGVSEVNGYIKHMNSTNNYSFGSFSAAINNTVLSELSNGNSSHFNTSGNSNVKVTSNVAVDTKLGNFQSYLVTETNSNINFSFYIDSQNGVMLREIINSTSFKENQSIQSTNVPMTQNSSSPSLISTGEIYEIIGVVAVIVVIGAVLGFRMKNSKKE